MSRSIKKGPFADASLLKKVDAQQMQTKSKLLRLGHVVQLFSLLLLV